MDPVTGDPSPRNLMTALKQLLPHQFRQSIKRRLFNVSDMQSRLANLHRAGFVCTGAVDGGAYEGEWTRNFWTVFPEVPCILVEPLPAMESGLRKITDRVPGSLHLAAALGGAPGHSFFRMGQTNSYLVHGEATPGDMDLIEVEVITLDSLVGALTGVLPNLLKLDLQGFELECLHGCEDLSACFEVIILEVSVLPIGGVPRFTEVDRYLEDRGYRLYDLLPQYYRPRDGALWQCDAFYVREGSSLIQSMEWA